jgi:hypothetical protein
MSCCRALPGYMSRWQAYNTRLEPFAYSQPCSYATSNMAYNAFSQALPAYATAFQDYSYMNYLCSRFPGSPW